MTNESQILNMGNWAIHAFRTRRLRKNFDMKYKFLMSDNELQVSTKNKNGITTLQH